MNGRLDVYEDMYLMRSHFKLCCGSKIHLLEYLDCKTCTRIKSAQNWFGNFLWMNQIKYWALSSVKCNRNGFTEIESFFAKKKRVQTTMRYHTLDTAKYSLIRFRFSVTRRMTGEHLSRLFFCLFFLAHFTWFERIEWYFSLCWMKLSATNLSKNQSNFLRHSTKFHTNFRLEF